MKIVFMGTPELAATVLESLIRAGHEIAAVVTQPDKPKGRGGAVSCSPVKLLAVKERIPVYQPVRIRSDEVFLKTLKEISPDVIAVAAFGQILPKAVLDIPKFGCLNVHTSLLPKYRGAAPIQQAILDGEKMTGVTIMYMAEGIDTGDIILQRTMPIEADDTGETLTNKLAALGGDLIVEALAGIQNGTSLRIRQDESKATYVGVLKKPMGDMDFTRSAEWLERLVRAMNPWPGAYTRLKGRLLKVWGARVLPADQAFGDNRGNVPGTVLASGRDGLYIQTGNGVLVLTELQCEGRKRMMAEEFLRGQTVPAGTVLGV